MKKIVKLSFGVSLIIGMITFTSCQKELDKIEANKSTVTKSMSPPESFGDVTLGEFHNAHLERVTQLGSFPEYQFNEQYELSVEYLPEEYMGMIEEANMGAVKEVSMGIAENPNLEEYFQEMAGAYEIPEAVKEHVNTIMTTVTGFGDKIFKDASYDIKLYLKKIRSLESIIKADKRLTIKEIEMLIRALTISYYSGFYWHHVCWHPLHKYHCMPPFPGYWPYYRWVRIVHADMLGYVMGYFRCGRICAILSANSASAMAARYSWPWWW